MTVDIDHGLLMALDALLKERNVTKAALNLGITQSSLSARLTRLRAVFADPLFVTATSGRGVVPTPRALELQEDLAGLLDHIDRMVVGRRSFHPKDARRTFVIAIRENPAYILAPGLVARIMEVAPNVRLAFVHPTWNTREKLESGEIDLLISGSEGETVDLMKRRLFQDHFMTAQRNGHPRGDGPLDLDTYCDLTHLVISTDGGGFSGHVDGLLAALGRTRKVMVSIPNYALVPTILSNSDCLCTLSSRLLLRFSHDLDLFDPPLDLPPLELSALWHRRNHEDGGHIWLRERLYETVANLG
ncbi:LysR family transcriptional regulator [Bosea sp. (in: a-proteobacteria)]|uniref:LysR family transcriptional regulator n=1 Tax=Bosea sp. (in: a-proteobacteria) TaxID=1871050 RepID=UPI002734E2DC|nr:LysR family transcriptional regulator [Bosea sp. (in: a-proteobacteria)]MDP3410357.1 LysR family transcriptional regulator [Bosea sp. (in: a-proteobacteria)]